MKETDNDVNKMLANLKRTLDDLSGNQIEKVTNKFGDLSGNQIEKVTNKFGDLSGNNLKYSSPHYDKGDNKEKFTDDHPLIEELTGPIGAALKTIIRTIFEETSVVGQAIRTVITPIVSIVMNYILFEESGDPLPVRNIDGGNWGGLNTVTIFSCFDNDGKCICKNNNCNVNKSVIGELIYELTGTNIMREGDKDGIIDYYAKGTLLLVGIVIASIIWKFVTLLKKITLLTLGRPK
tara:strand:- start:5973 stop:6680 length:708 start_codon:yes stop_codon:yes gene_type:complete